MCFDVSLFPGNPFRETAGRVKIWGRTVKQKDGTGTDAVFANINGIIPLNSQQVLVSTKEVGYEGKTVPDGAKPELAFRTVTVRGEQQGEVKNFSMKPPIFGGLLAGPFNLTGSLHFAALSFNNEEKNPGKTDMSIIAINGKRKGEPWTVHAGCLGHENCWNRGGGFFKQFQSRNGPSTAGILPDYAFGGNPMLPGYSQIAALSYKAKVKIFVTGLNTKYKTESGGHNSQVNYMNMYDAETGKEEHENIFGKKNYTQFLALYGVAAVVHKERPMVIATGCGVSVFTPPKVNGDFDLTGEWERDCIEKCPDECLFDPIDKEEGRLVFKYEELKNCHLQMKQDSYAIATARVINDRVVAFAYGVFSQALYKVLLEERKVKLLTAASVPTLRSMYLLDSTTLVVGTDTSINLIDVSLTLECKSQPFHNHNLGKVQVTKVGRYEKYGLYSQGVTLKSGRVWAFTAYRKASLTKSYGSSKKPFHFEKNMLCYQPCIAEQGVCQKTTGKYECCVQKQVFNVSEAKRHDAHAPCSKFKTDISARLLRVDDSAKLSVVDGTLVF